MTNYKRFFLPGGTYFFTVNLAERNKTLLIDQADDLREVFAQVKEEQPFSIDTIVILPEHLDAIWKLPEGDSDFSNRWRKLRAVFRNWCRKGNGYRRVEDGRVKEVFGREVFGNMLSSMSWITSNMWITFIIIR